MLRGGAFVVLCNVLLGCLLFVLVANGQSTSKSFVGWVDVRGGPIGTFLSFSFNNTLHSVSPFLHTKIVSINATISPQQLFELEVNHEVYTHTSGSQFVGFSGPDYSLTTSLATFTGAVFQDVFSPCHSNYLQEPSSLRMGPVFGSPNVTVNLELEVFVELTDTTFTENNATLVPQASREFFTFFPSGTVDLTLTLASVPSNNASLNQQLNAILVGCGDDQQVINLTTAAVTEWSFTLPGKKGPVIMEFQAAQPLPSRPGFIFRVTARDDSLKTWQIVLICVAAAVTVAIVAVIVGIIVYLVWKSRTPYQTLN